MTDVRGTVAPGFEHVAEAFATTGTPGVSAQCCVHRDGVPVVDLWRHQEGDAVQVIFSATKGVTAACANLLVQRGVLDLDAPVTRYWPEYGCRGKEITLVRWVLSHRSGVLAPAPGLTLDDVLDWTTMADALADAEPCWEPGSAYGYHAQTFGWLVGELVRRTDGRGLGRFVAEEIAGPAGADLWIGFPASEEHRLLPAVGPHDPEPQPSEADLARLVGPHLLPAFTLAGALTMDILATVGDRRCRAAELGASCGVGNARGLARAYDRLLATFTGSTVADILRAETAGPDRVLSTPGAVVEQRYGRGFTLHEQPGRVSFGHDGVGGITAFADPRRRVAFAFATSEIVMGPSGLDPRVRPLVDAVYAACASV